MQTMNITSILYSAAVWIIPLTIAIVLHEVSHGWVANAFGDPTARRLGRLSVNPVTHVDPVGTILLPLSLAIAHLPVFGWAKPVPVVAGRLRNPRVHMMLVALAGPGMNFALALLGTIALAIFVGLWTGGTPTGASAFLFDNLINFVMINIFLAIFNLLPIPLSTAAMSCRACSPPARGPICADRPLWFPAADLPAGDPADDRAQRKCGRARDRPAGPGADRFPAQVCRPLGLSRCTAGSSSTSHSGLGRLRASPRSSARWRSGG